jgi:hypothetical protein
LILQGVFFSNINASIFNISKFSDINVNLVCSLKWSNIKIPIMFENIREKQKKKKIKVKSFGAITGQLRNF